MLGVLFVPNAKVTQFVNEAIKEINAHNKLQLKLGQKLPPISNDAVNEVIWTKIEAWWQSIPGAALDRYGLLTAGLVGALGEKMGINL